MSDRNALDWPRHISRTPDEERNDCHKFETALLDAVKDIKQTMEKMEVDAYRLLTNTDHRKDRPNVPYANAPEPDDPGAVVQWTRNEQQYAIACDHWTDLRSNVREIGLYVEEKRMMDQRPVSTGEEEFANAQLPPENENASVVASQDGDEIDPYAVLGVREDASDGVIEKAARERLKETHPDSGGEAEEYARVKKARAMVME